MDKWLYPPMKNVVEIGYFSRPHGVRGELAIKLFNLNSNSIQIGVKFCVSDSHEMEFAFDKVRYGNKLIVGISGVDSLEKAQCFVGKKIYINKSVLRPLLSSDEFLLNDVISFYVYTSAGNLIGQVMSFSSNGAQNIALVKDKSGKSIDVLLIKPFLKEIDFENKTLILDLPEVEV